MVGHLSNVDCVAWHPNANYIASGSADRTVRVWDVNDGECVRVFAGHSAGVRSLVFAPDGRTLASSADDGRIHVWDLTKATCVISLKGHVGPVYSLDYAGGGGLLTSGGADDTVRVWDVSTPTPLEGAEENDEASGKVIKRVPLKTFPTKNTPVFKVKFSRRNLCLAMGARRANK